MNTPNNVYERDYLYGDRRATVFLFNNGVKIIGFKKGIHLDLRVLTIGFNPAREGLGEEALRLLRPKFKNIIVNEIYETTLPFWEKMKKRGLVDDLGTVKIENYGYIGVVE